jgi:hypothetical protein
MNEMRLQVALGQLDLAMEWLSKCQGEDAGDIRALLGQARTKLLGAIDTCKAAEDREYRSTLTAGD